MRVQIMTDMEGVSGIIAWDQVNGGKPMYEEGRCLYTEEIDAAVRGAASAGATEIVVVDCHGAGGPWIFNSLVPELLDPRCEWVAGHTWSRYTDTLEAGCDAVLLVGMHAKAGTADGVLSHTISTVLWRHLWFNGQAVGEVGVNAAVCGYYDSPVLLVTGDEAVCRESTELLGEGLTTVAVKKGLSRYAARQIPPERARQALSDLPAVPPYQLGSPTTITFEVGSPENLDTFRGRQGVTLEPPYTVRSVADDWMAAWNQIWHW